MGNPPVYIPPYKIVKQIRSQLYPLDAWLLAAIMRQEGISDTEAVRQAIRFMASTLDIQPPQELRGQWVKGKHPRRKKPCSDAT